MVKINAYNIIILGALILFGVRVLAADPNFSLHNKSKQPIDIELLQGGVKSTGIVKPGQFEDRHIDINRPTTLTIKSAREVYKASFATNRTLYLNWDENHSPMLYHQRGPFLGILNKTDRGYSTSNNIADNEILPLQITLGPPTSLNEIPLAKIEHSHGICTGTLISANAVITSAHCFDNPGGKIVTPKSVSIRLPGGSMSKPYKILSFFVRPDLGYLQDIAVVILAEIVSDAVRIPAIATDIKKILPGTRVNSFGFDTNFWQESSILANTNPLSGLDKDLLVSWSVRVKPFASVRKVGDSGGPLFYNYDKQFVLVGVFKRLDAINKDDTADVFTAVEPFLPALLKQPIIQPKTISIK